MNNPAYKNPTLPVAERIEDLLSRMTLEEKAGQLNQWLNLGTDQYDQVRRGKIFIGHTLQEIIHLDDGIQDILKVIDDLPAFVRHTQPRPGCVCRLPV